MKNTKTRRPASLAAAHGSPHRGSRCGVCYWALYDGDWCQNKKCVMSGKSVNENRVQLTNEEAQLLIDMGRLQDLPYCLDIIYKRGTPKADSMPSLREQIHRFLETENEANAAGEQRPPPKN